MDATGVRDWQVHFESLGTRISGCFGRRDLRRRATAYLRGLLGSVQRKNSWQLAEHVGDATPHGFQRLLGRVRWEWVVSVKLRTFAGGTPRGGRLRLRHRVHPWPIRLLSAQLTIRLTQHRHVHPNMFPAIIGRYTLCSYELDQ